MIKLSVYFLAITVVMALLGFGEWTPTVAPYAQVFFFVGIVMFTLSLFGGAFEKYK